MDLRLQDLIDLQKFQGFLERLRDVYELTTAIVDTEGRVLAASAWQELCTNFHRAHPTCGRACTASDQYILSHMAEANPAVTYECLNGLVDVAVPIIVDGRHIASFFTGQFFLEPPDVEDFRRRAATCGFDQVAYLGAVAKVPVWTQEKLERHLQFIKSLADLVASVAEKTVEQNRTQAELATLSRRLQLATAAAGAGVWDWDLVSGQISWDQRMLELYGTTREAFSGTIDAWEEALEPAGRSRSLAECQAALAGEREYDTEFQVRRPDGTVIDVAATGHVVRDDAGRPLRMLGLNIDITDQKTAERELHESRENLALALRSSEMGVWRLDLRTDKRHFDELVCRCLGLEFSRFRGTAEEFYRVVHPDDRTALADALRDTIDTGAPSKSNTEPSGQTGPSTTLRRAPASF